MHELYERFNLLFHEGEGGGESSGEGAEGATAAAGQKSLEDFGVPHDMAEKYRASKPAPVSRPVPQVATEPPAPETKTYTEADISKMSLKDFLKLNPEANRENQESFKKRIREDKAKNEFIDSTYTLLGKKYGFDVSDPSKIDYKGISDAVSNDDSYYEDLAAEMGTDIDTAKRIDKREKEAHRAEEEARQTIKDYALQKHFGELQRQAESFKSIFPEFDLDAELNNDTFLRLTSPEVGLSVSDAYYAVHHEAIEKAKIAETARNTQAALSKSIQSGRNIPSENGSSRNSSPVQPLLYSQMNSEQRKQFEASIKSGKVF